MRPVPVALIEISSLFLTLFIPFSPGVCLSKGCPNVCSVGPLTIRAELHQQLIVLRAAAWSIWKFICFLKTHLLN